MLPIMSWQNQESIWRELLTTNRRGACWTEVTDDCSWRSGQRSILFCLSGAPSENMRGLGAPKDRQLWGKRVRCPSEHAKLRMRTTVRLACYANHYKDICIYLLKTHSLILPDYIVMLAKSLSKQHKSERLALSETYRGVYVAYAPDKQTRKYRKVFLLFVSIYVSSVLTQTVTQADSLQPTDSCPLCSHWAVCNHELVKKNLQTSSWRSDKQPFFYSCWT